MLGFPDAFAASIHLLPDGAFRVISEEVINWIDPLAVRPDDFYRRSVKFLQCEANIDQVLGLGLSIIHSVTFLCPRVLSAKTPGFPSLLQGAIEAGRRQICNGTGTPELYRDRATILTLLRLVLSVVIHSLEELDLTPLF